MIEEDLQNALARYYPSNNSAFDDDLNDVVDFIQESLECCGVNNTADWAMFSPYTMELGRLPASCCDRDEPSPCPENEAFDEVGQQVMAGLSGTCRQISQVEYIYNGSILPLLCHFPYCTSGHTCLL